MKIPGSSKVFAIMMNECFHHFKALHYALQKVCYAIGSMLSNIFSSSVIRCEHGQTPVESGALLQTYLADIMPLKCNVVTKARR